MTHVLSRTQLVPAPLEEVFEFFSRPENLARITPNWLHFQIVGGGQLEMRQGLQIQYRIRPIGLPQRWVSSITVYDPPHRFVDEQVQGPYSYWRHLHEFEPASAGRGAPRTRVHDRVEYRLPFGPLGLLAHAVLVRRQLEAIFDHRERVIVGLWGAEGSASDLA